MRRVITLAIAAQVFAAAGPAETADARIARERKAVCKRIAKEVGGLFAEFRRRKAFYHKRLRCSLATWRNYLSERDLLLKIRGVGRKAARMALRDLDRRNARLRSSRKRCQAAREALREVIRRYNTRRAEVREELARCGRVFPILKVTYEGDFRAP